MANLFKGNLKEYAKDIKEAKKKNWYDLWNEYGPKLCSNESKEFWKKLQNCTKYNAKSGKSLVSSLLLENGDLANENEKNNEIEKKYVQLFDCEPADSSQWTQTEFNRWNFFVEPSTKNKALSIDLLPDTILLPCSDHLQEWNRANMLYEATQYINEKHIFLNHMCGRLVLINKVHPKVP